MLLSSLHNADRTVSRGVVYALAEKNVMDCCYRETKPVQCFYNKNDIVRWQ